MYRYTVDNAVTYTSEDLVLFRESPFASWMERLTLENPDHGIPPDADTTAPREFIERQDDVAQTLRAQGREVSLIDWEAEEGARRYTTLESMRSGADFIVNGQLALGPLSGSCNLLMRTSGFSELGGYLYIPCDTQARTTLHSAFRLCFLADLLHSLQGQLPPQLLIIRGSADVVPLQSEDHIYSYRAVKQRFMNAMRDFRKHRMPDPAGSSHFGRWSDCANEVLKQKVLREEEGLERIAEEELAPVAPVMSAVGRASTQYDLDSAQPAAVPTTTPSSSSVAPRAAIPARDEVAIAETGTATLAEQASQLGTDAGDTDALKWRPGPTPNLARFPAPARETAESAGDEGDPADGARRNRRRSDRRDHSLPEHSRRSSDVALQNLQFIGSGQGDTLLDHEVGDSGRTTAPAPRVQEETPAEREVDTPPAQDELAARVSSAPRQEPIHRLRDVASQQPDGFAIGPTGKPHPLDSAGFSVVATTGVDMDAVTIDSPDPVLVTADAGFDSDRVEGREAGGTPTSLSAERTVQAQESITPFSDSLITNIHFRD